jgi:hypothetical protein
MEILHDDSIEFDSTILRIEDEILTPMLRKPDLAEFRLPPLDSYKQHEYVSVCTAYLANHVHVSESA